MNWEQLKTILWLRWRLTRNQWIRGGGFGAVLALVFAFGALTLGALSFVGSFLGAMYGLSSAEPFDVSLVWLGVTVAFLFFWMIGLLAELQRSETIDLQRLMHLPVALGQMFTVNYLASHLSLSIIVAVPAMLGLALGLTFGRGLAMVLLVPLALSMVFMVTTWTYCLRGWLATMMTNPRRRRSIIMGITLAFVLLGQAPNLYFNVIRRSDGSGAPRPRTAEERQNRRDARKVANRELLDKLLAAQKFIPPLWVPVGARALAEGNAWPAVFGALGCFALGAVGLRRAYHGTVKFYHGETGGRAGVRVLLPNAAPVAPVKAGRRFLELRLPGVPEQAAALALVTIRSLFRAPEVKMMWGTSFIVTVILGATILPRSTPRLPEAAKPLVAAGAMAFSLFMLVQFLTNQFGFDRHGFRALLLSPANRRLILLGKNLASFPVGAAFGMLALGVTSIWLRLPPIAIASALFQLIAMLLLAGLGGNLLSILVPYRIEPGSVKPTKMPGAAMLVMVLCQLLFPLVMAPAFVPPLAEWLWQLAGWPGTMPVNLILSVALASLAGFVYWWTLEPLGRLLQRRETKILDAVTVEVE